MLVNLTPLKTELRRLQEIPTTFFQNIEGAASFDDNLFPDWTNTAFGTTALKRKFKIIYDEYKKLSDDNKKKVRDAFSHSNQIERLCNNENGIQCITLKELPFNIRDPIDTTFRYLYNQALKHNGFTTLVHDNVRDAIDRFISDNLIQVCPICGLEVYTNLEGQALIPFDHWLCIDYFPLSAVNFDNLIPIGSRCNERPAKGSTNILVNENQVRIRTLYPFMKHHGIKSTFIYINEPTINAITDDDWSLTIIANDANEQYLVDSWNSIFNILSRYRDYFKKVIHPMWENEYKRFIEEAGIGHANTILDLKNNFRIWQAAFQIKERVGSLLYRAFIDNMINNASDAYLYSMCQNLKR